MSKRMTSETIIFDTDWLTETDFGSESSIYVSIDYHAYDTLKVIVNIGNVALNDGALFQEFEVYKLKNSELAHLALLSEAKNEYFSLYFYDDELGFYLEKPGWESNIKGIGSIYIKGVKR